MTEHMIQGIVVGLLLTELLELSFAALLRIRDVRSLGLILFTNLLTNPLAVLFFYISIYGFQFPFIPATAVIETVVVISEWLIYRQAKLPVSSPLLFSLASNGVSWICGTLIQLL